MRKTLAILATIVSAFSIITAPPAAAEVSLRWGECPDLGFPTPGLECATLDVPLDYRDPDGATIQVAVSRLPSTNPARRRGVLLMNPGGPGGSGLTLPSALVAAGLPAAVQESYDLIGFDPRGVEHSTPVSCGLPDLLTTLPPYALGPADVARRAAEARDLANRCVRGPSAEILPYINTANTARDMDRIRGALGERRISYLGFSYGTYLGAVYATLFGDRTDRIVLDSVLGPDGLDVTASRRFAQGFADTFPDFAAWAAARHDVYGLGDTPSAVTATYFELAGRLDRAPVGDLDGSLFRLATFSVLYTHASFPDLAELWRTLTLPPLTPAPDNLLSAQFTVVCNDSDWPESVRTYQRNVELDRIRFPMFGAAAANIWPCAFWPDPVENPVRISDRGPSNILLVQNLRDPATPLVGAREMRGTLGQRARMVTVDQGGHGVYVVSANSCGNEAVTRFLADGARPARDAFCAKENGPGGRPFAPLALRF